MLRISIMLVAVLAIGCAFGVHAQDTAGRANDLATALDKTKYKKKEKRNVLVELYIDIKNEVAVRTDLTAYTGLYEGEGHRIQLTVSAGGEATGFGYDQQAGSNKAVNFMLRDGRIQGAMLTGLKVYDNGETRKFEGVFVNRTVTTGRNKDQIENQDRAFGLGFIESGPVIAGGSENNSQDWTNRVFVERK
jgi:hypothetical protein